MKAHMKAAIKARALPASVTSAGITALLLSASAHAATVRIANQGDVLSMDPHSLNETLQFSVLGNVYEPLVALDKKLALTPALAASWKQTSPTVWRFELRKGVKFHDGTPFTADDVVFSMARAAGDGSDVKSYVTGFKHVRKTGAHTVEIETDTPQPILPQVLTSVYIMSRQWSESHNATRPVDRRKGVENTASFKANGTGPYRVRERQPGVRTVFERHPGYWGAVEGNAREVIYTPIGNPSTRVAALLTGEVDVMEPVPVQDIVRVNAHAGTRVLTGPDLRTLFLGMDQKRDELLFSSVKGKNPFKDKRVRQAFYQAIDIHGIQKSVMRGASRPAALMIGPGIHGWTAAQDKRLPHDIEAAKKLMAEAGYPNGFEVTLHCPNDRYVNDSQICQAVAASLARIHVKVNLQAETKAVYFPKILRRDTSFYLLGAISPTYDAHYILDVLNRCPDDKAGMGQYNLGSYCNPELDKLTDQIKSEADPAKRTALIHQALQMHSDDIGHLPLHQQSLAWGVSKKVSLTQRADNFMPFKWISIQP